MFKRKTSIFIILVIVLSLVFSFSFGENVNVNSDNPKYVFYFIGDGLGSAQRQLAEYYEQEVSGDKSEKLLINSFPVAGINTTYSTDSLVTDSAAAGTALATGYKTDNGVISQTPDGKNVESLIEFAEERGMGTGIITTTRLTHATPAVFAAHNASRDNENEIAEDFVASGVDFFAGGGARHFVSAKYDDQLGDPTGATIKSKRTGNRDLVKEFNDLGYQTFIGTRGVNEFNKINPVGEEKVFAAFTYSHLPYEIDRINSGYDLPSLAEITEKGIDVLSKYDKGFFMMIEGGRIDHACHANDPTGSIYDTLAFNDAVKEAYDFYLDHPKETLIVIVGDHETGGMGLGFSQNYFLNIDSLENVKVSVEDILQKKYSGDRDSYFKYLEENFGLKELNDEETALIKKAMDSVDNGEEVGTLYGSYDPVAIAATHVLSERANLQWTTYAHTGTSIPMSAIGVGSENFGGYKDNTEIAKSMMKLMNFKFK